MTITLEHLQQSSLPDVKEVWQVICPHFCQYDALTCMNRRRLKGRNKNNCWNVDRSGRRPVLQNPRNHIPSPPFIFALHPPPLSQLQTRVWMTPYLGNRESNVLF